MEKKSKLKPQLTPPIWRNQIIVFFKYSKGQGIESLIKISNSKKNLEFCLTDDAKLRWNGKMKDEKKGGGKKQRNTYRLKLTFVGKDAWKIRFFTAK